jgi:hypothetical protein
MLLEWSNLMEKINSYIYIYLFIYLFIYYQLESGLCPVAARLA